MLGVAAPPAGVRWLRNDVGASPLVVVAFLGPAHADPLSVVVSTAAMLWRHRGVAALGSGRHVRGPIEAGNVNDPWGAPWLSAARVAHPAPPASARRPAAIRARPTGCATRAAACWARPLAWEGWRDRGDDTSASPRPTRAGTRPGVGGTGATRTGWPEGFGGMVRIVVTPPPRDRAGRPTGQPWRRQCRDTCGIVPATGPDREACGGHELRGHRRQLSPLAATAP